jgi:hypothetical protein
MYIVAGLVRDAHQARGLVRALAGAAFERDEIDMSGGPVSGLVACGVPEGEAHVLAEGIRRGGAVVMVKADDDMEAEQAALIMAQHGAVDVEACSTGWRNQGWRGRITAPEDRVRIERYGYVFGEYPGGAGRIYRDPRVRIEHYKGPERRRTHKPHRGFERRAA